MKRKVVMPVETGGFTVEDFPEELEAEFIISPARNEEEVIAITQDANAIITSVMPPMTKRLATTKYRDFITFLSSAKRR